MGRADPGAAALKLWALKLQLPVSSPSRGSYNGKFSIQLSSYEGFQARPKFLQAQRRRKNSIEIRAK